MKRPHNVRQPNESEKDYLARTTWPEPQPPRTIRSTECPLRRWDVPHYRPDGTCMCNPPRDEALEPQIVRGTE